ncbi:MAG TPA: hypothetical protein DD417_13850 [Elusimicrobia bacterium]|nr:hypothetical protein [Elusimicrobiota bacterium]
MMRKLLAARLAVGLSFASVTAAAEPITPPPTPLAGPAVSELALRAVGPSMKAPDRDAALKALRDGVPWAEMVESLGLEELGRTADALYQRLHHLKVPMPRMLPGAELAVNAAAQRLECRLLRVELGRGPGGTLVEFGGQFGVGEGSSRLGLMARRRGGRASIRLEMVPGSSGASAAAAWDIGKVSLRAGAGGLSGRGDRRALTAGLGFPVGKKQRVEYSFGQERHQALWSQVF